MDRIKIPFVVTREERAEIKQAYQATVECAGEEHLQYISSTLPAVLKRLNKADEDWLVSMAIVANQLASLIETDSAVPNSARRQIVGALYYLCDPFEVIPDYVPGRGYADDALVLNTCLSELRQCGVALTFFASTQAHEETNLARAR